MDWPRGSRVDWIADQQWQRGIEALGLPDKQRLIVAGIMAERKDAAIARELGISYNTLRTHLTRLYRDLGVKGRIGLVKLVCGKANMSSS